MIHLQDKPPGWLTALLASPDCDTLKSVDDPSVLKQAKETWAKAGRDPARLYTMFRLTNIQTAPAGDWADACAHWRQMFPRAIDATFKDQNYGAYIDVMCEANEYTAESTWSDPDGGRYQFQSMQAASYVFNADYRGKVFPETTRLGLMAGPVNNRFPPKVLELAIADDQAVDYHAYTCWLKGLQHPQDWPAFSGLWNTLEVEYGLKPYWCFGECGPFASVAGGWRHPDCLSANEDELVNAMSIYFANLATTAAYRDGRLLGSGAWFTYHLSKWQYYKLETEQLMRLAAALAKVWRPGPENNMTDDQAAVIRSVSADLKAQAAKLDAIAPPEPAAWWTLLPNGPLTPSRKTTNMTTALAFYHLPTDAAAYTTRTYAAPGAASIDVFERAGAMFRVTQTPAIWVPATELKAFS